MQSTCMTIIDLIFNWNVAKLAVVRVFTFLGNGIHTLIESSNRPVLQISLLEKYIFLTNKIFSTKYKQKFILISHVYS